MPAPQASLMSQIAIQHFTSLGIRLPQNWSQPTGEAGKQYVEAFPEQQRAVAVPPMLLFVPASNNHYHVDSCVDMSDKFRKFFDETSKAVCQGWQQWMMGAQVVGVMINGPVGMITPGCVAGPPIGPMAMPPALKNTPQLLKYSNAVIMAFNDAFTAWATGFSGTLNYLPTFALCPMPLHPPTPNIPAPIASAGSSPGEALLAEPALKAAMAAKLGDPTAAHSMPLFESMAKAIKQCFDQWKATTQINNVLGTGPVPVYAPPVVPTGPVVMGIGNSAGVAFT